MRARKSVQLYYGTGHGNDADLNHELTVLCRELDANRLFIRATTDSVQNAEDLVRYSRRAAAGREMRSK